MTKSNDSAKIATVIEIEPNALEMKSGTYKTVHGIHHSRLSER